MIPGNLKDLPEKQVPKEGSSEMKVMVLIKACKESESGVMPVRQKMKEMARFNQELAEAGILLTGEGLKPSSAGVRIRFSKGNRIITDGPFPETNELVAGYWIWQVQSMEEAISWVKKCPNPMPQDSEVEIRPIYSMEDVEELIAKEAVGFDQQK